VLWDGLVVGGGEEGLLADGIILQEIEIDLICRVDCLKLILAVWLD